MGGNLIMAGKIIIYGTDTCPFCIQARAAYGDRAVYINVGADPEKLKEMLGLSGGKRQVPVIVEGDRISVGFAGETSLRGGVPLFGGT
jgi:glutaredoxin 3